MSKLIVLIPHYNNSKELLKSIATINETIEVDILIVDDGSRISLLPSMEELKKYYNKGKIFIELLPSNQGIEFALNKGLEVISSLNYEFIGRLDCGDYCIRNRFTKQLDYLEKNNEIYLLGTWANIISSTGEKLFVLKHPVNSDEIKNKMYVNSAFIHPSVVFRSSVLNKIPKYPINYKAAEDYAFFFKIIKSFKAENLPEPLIDYVIDENSISSKNRKLQVKSRIRIILDNFYFGYYPIYGLIRNIVLLFMSRNTTTTIKRLIGSND